MHIDLCDSKFNSCDHSLAKFRNEVITLRESWFSFLKLSRRSKNGLNFLTYIKNIPYAFKNIDRVSI